MLQPTDLAGFATQTPIGEIQYAFGYELRRRPSDSIRFSRTVVGEPLSRAVRRISRDFKCPERVRWFMNIPGMHQVGPSAALSALRRAMSVNGLNRHATAPAASTLWRSASSLSAVMKIIGVSV